MKKNNKIGLLVTVMVLSACAFGMNSAYSQPATEGVILTAKDSNEEVTTIKANKDTLESAKADMAKKNYQSAITYLNAYIAGKPKRYEGYKLRGECYYALRQYELAQQDFQTAVDIKTSDDKFVTGAKVVGAVVLGADKNDQYQNTELGNLYGELMYAQKALNNPEYEETYQKAFQYNSHIYLPKPKANEILKINCPQKYGKIWNPQGADADFMAVINDIEAENYHEAAYKLPKLASEYPTYYLTHYLTGVVMAGLERDEDAISSFEKALKYNPYDFESLASLGQIYYSKAENNFSKADANKSISYFEKAKVLNPNLSTYDYYIGLDNLILRNNDAAISAFDKAISKRANDYNSMYYKAIAQEMKGDYPSVIDGATKLMNRHVSNYNSVLYLRALAYFKSGNSDKALEDAESIFSNLSDIYNADIKKTSAKEKTLENYVHYLKAQIIEQKGSLAGPEYSRAFENPVIKALANGSDYSFTMSPNDFENQYDYMRTTFSNLGNIAFNGNEYIISNQSVVPVFANISDGITPVSKQSDAPVDLRPSLAQMLAQPTFLSSKPVVQPVVKQETAVAKTDNVIQAQNTNEEIKIGTKPPISAPVTQSKGESMIFTADGTNKVSVNSETPKPVEKPEIAQAEPTQEGTVLTAPEQKSTEDFNITYNNGTKVITTNTAENKETVPEQKPVQTTIATTSEPSETLVKATSETGSVAAGLAVADTVDENNEAPKISLRQSSSPEELLLQKDETDSMAQMLAVQSIFNPESFEPYDEEAVKVAGNVKSDVEKVSAPQQTDKNAAESVNQPTVVSAPIQKEAQQFSISYPETEPVKDIVVQQKEITPPEIVVQTPEPAQIPAEPVITTAEDVKETPDFKISYNNDNQTETPKQDVLEHLNDETKDLELQKESANESLAKTIARAEAETEPNTVVSVENVPQTTAVVLPDLEETVDKAAKSDSAKIVEKYANVDLSEYNIQKSTPEINEGDEVIVFNPNSTIFGKKEQKAVSQNMNLAQQQITDDFSQLHKEVQTTAVNEPQEKIAEVKDAVAENNEVTVAEKATETSEKVVNNVVEQYEGPELIFPDTVEIEKETKTAQAEIPTVVPKVKPKKADEQTVQADIKAAQTTAPQDEEWLKDFLDKAEETPEKQKAKAKKAETLNEFLSEETDEQTIKEVKSKKPKKEKKENRKKEVQNVEDAAITVITDEEKRKVKEQEKAIKLAQKQEQAELRKIQQKEKAELRKAQKLAEAEEKAAQKQIRDAEKSVARELKAAAKAEAKELKQAQKLAAKKTRQAEKEAKRAAYTTKKEVIGDEKTNIVKWFKNHKKAEKTPTEKVKKVKTETEQKVVKEKKEFNLFPKKEQKTVTEKPVKEKKEFQWWWKKEKNNVQKEIKVKEQKVKKVKTSQEETTEKKKFNWDNLFLNKKEKSQDTEQPKRKWVVKQSKQD